MTGSSSEKVDIENRFEVIRFFQMIETKFPVDKWTINEVNIYPILRIMIGFRLIVKDHFKGPAVKPTFFLKIKTICDKLVSKLRSKATFLELEKTDIVFLGSIGHDAFWKKRRYSKFFEPLIEQNTTYTSTYLQCSYGFEKQLKGRSFSQVLLSATFDHSFRSVFHRKFRSDIWWNEFAELPRSQEFIHEINLHLGISTNEVRTIIALAKNIFDLSLLYEKVLTKTKPTLVMIANFYNSHGLALILAAKRKGIPSVDMQHGPQLAGSIAYARWKKVPKNGFNVLPDFFWCWDVESRNAIDRWTKSFDVHQSLLGGNPWLEYHMNRKVEKENEYSRVLYTLQPLPTKELFPKYLVDLILANKKFKWNIRFHPLQDESQVVEVLHLFQNKNCEVKFEDGFDHPLPVSILQTDVHITNFSGSAIEASQLGKKTIILSSVGLQIFAKLIQQKKVFYLDDQKSLLSLLQLVLLSENIEPCIPDSREIFKVLMDKFL